jgi:predicted transcriptional regulator
VARPKGNGKKKHRLIIAVPPEMHEALQQIADKRTSENNGVINYTVSMIGRQAFEQLIEKELGKGALQQIREKLEKSPNEK